MTSDQFHALAELLSLDSIYTAAAKEALISEEPIGAVSLRHGMDTAHLQQAVNKLAEAELRIRGAFICHSPSAWEVVVGHHDHHRAPGKISLSVGDTVRLVCARVSVMVPVRVAHIPDDAQGYYGGVILNIEPSSMHYRRGDSVKFSDDQVILPAGARKPRRPVPI